MKLNKFKKLLPFIALIAAHFIWGANFVVAKLTLTEIPIMSLSFLRFFFASLLLLPFVLPLGKKHLKIRTQDISPIILVATLIITLNIALFYQGLIQTTAINASVISLVTPVLSVILGWLFFKEKIYVVNVLGITTGLVGALIVIGFPLIFFGNLDLSNFLGNLLIILSSLAFVMGALLSKKFINNYPIPVLTFFYFLIGAVTFFVPALFDYLKNPGWINNLSLLGGFGLAYITVMSSITAYFLLNYGFKNMPISEASLFQYFEPAVAATFAVIFLSERISFSFIIGTCLVVLGVYWGTLGREERHHHLLNRHHKI